MRAHLRHDRQRFPGYAGETRLEVEVEVEVGSAAALAEPKATREDETFEHETLAPQRPTPGPAKSLLGGTSGGERNKVVPTSPIRCM